VRRETAGILVILAVGARAYAGESVLAEVGSRVRVTSFSDASLRIGTVAAIEADALVLRRAGDDSTLRIPIGELRRLEVSSGKRSQAGRGAMIGAAIGALPGLLLTFGDYSDDVHGDGPSPAAVAAMGAAGGAAVGAAIGRVVKTERWVPAGLHNAGVAVVPARGGVAFALRIAWGSGVQGGH
jgi:hypothetical protein